MQPGCLYRTVPVYQVRESAVHPDSTALESVTSLRCLNRYPHGIVVLRAMQMYSRRGEMAQ